MDDYKKYLGENVLTEDKVITYRQLSRALSVHVNTAKRMLYEFHRLQNDKSPGSVHATYLVYGTKKEADHTPVTTGVDGDVEMTNSLTESEPTDEVVPVVTLSLVQETRLTGVLAEYEDVSSVHVYSVGSHPTNDLTLLSDVAQQTYSIPASGDSSKDQKVFGTIVNPHVRLRERQKSGAASSGGPVKQESRSVSKPASNPLAAPVAKVKEEARQASSAPTKEKTSSSAPTKKPAPPKRGGSSGIVQAFSKAATAKAKKAESSQAATPSGDDSSLHPMSDDGEDDSEMPQPKARDGDTRSRKKEREEELRRMMEEDDDEEDAEPEKSESPEPVEEPPVEEPKKEEPAEVTTSSGDGRRRGKRKVMKKKQIMDESGYLVTKQEAVWESFSEDEAPPPKPKPSSSAPAAASNTKSKKGGTKSTQGSIMSFFSKKT